MFCAFAWTFSAWCACSCQHQRVRITAGRRWKFRLELNDESHKEESPTHICHMRFQFHLSHPDGGCSFSSHPIHPTLSFVILRCDKLRCFRFWGKATSFIELKKRNGRTSFVQQGREFFFMCYNQYRREHLIKGEAASFKKCSRLAFIIAPSWKCEEELMRTIL